jgi:hypothetical protein
MAQRLSTQVRSALLGSLLGLAIVVQANTASLRADCSCKDNGEQEYQKCCYCIGCCMPTAVDYYNINWASWDFGEQRYFCGTGHQCWGDPCDPIGG